MARQWKSYFFMFPVNYGDKQMVPIQKLFQKSCKAVDVTVIY